MTQAPPYAPPNLADQPTSELIRLASTQISELVRDELKLAKAEMTAKGKTAGAGAGMLGAAGVLAGYGVGALLVCIGLLLALVLPGWAAALIVTVVLFAVAAILALLGRKRLNRAMPAVPTVAVDGLKTDIAQVQAAISRGGHAHNGRLGS